MIFLHFEPTGNALLHDKDTGHYHRIDEQYHDSVKERKGGHSSDSDAIIPPYIQRESPEESHWRNEHPEGWTPVSLLDNSDEWVGMARCVRYCLPSSGPLCDLSNISHIFFNFSISHIRCSLPTPTSPPRKARSTSWKKN